MFDEKQFRINVVASYYFPFPHPIYSPDKCNLAMTVFLDI